MAKIWRIASSGNFFKAKFRLFYRNTRYGVHKPLCVRRLRMTVHGICTAVFDDTPFLHYGQMVRHVLYDAKVVGNEQVCETVIFLKVVQKIQHLCLHGDVKGGNRFVAYYKRRLEHKGARYAYTLPLTAGKLVRVTVEHVFGQSYPFQKPLYVLPSLAVVVEDTVDTHRFHKSLPYAEHGIERSERVLEYYLYIAP